MENLALLDRVETEPASGTRLAEETTRRALIAVVSDNPALADSIESVCDFLDIGVELLPSMMSLATLLPSLRPMAVVAEMDCGGQDGCHVLMEVAAVDRDLPVMLLLGTDTDMAGAVDAVAELWGLRAVTVRPTLPRVGQFVDFLFRAGRRAGSLHAVPVQSA